MTSERPEGLSPLELEQYELAIEEQAYPFEEKAIDVHESNLKLISLGVYNVWIEKSLQKLAEFVPARYAKPEEISGIVTSLEVYIFEIVRPAPPAPSESDLPTAAASESAEPGQAEEPGSVTGSERAEPVRLEKPGSVTDPESGRVQEPVVGKEVDPEEPLQMEKPGAAIESQPAESGQVEEPLQIEQPVSAL
jgi:hypothetical protein